MIADDVKQVAGSPGGDERVGQETSENRALNGARRDGTAAALDPIASALRRLHDDVAAEPIPDDFMRLLASIDDKRESRAS